MAKRRKTKIRRNIYQGGGELLNLEGLQQQQGLQQGLPIQGQVQPQGAGVQGVGQLGGLAGDALQATGSPVGTIGGGALKGAAAGAALGPIGAGVGAVIGGIGGILQNKKQKEAEEERAKLINQQGIKASMQNFQQANAVYAEGGSLNQDANITEFNGLPHGLGGLPLTQGAEVEDNETRGIGDSKDYIFSDLLKIANNKRTFADESKRIEKKYTGADNDSFAIEAKNADINRLRFEQEALKDDNYKRDLEKLRGEYPNRYSATHTMPDGTVMPGATHEQAVRQGQYQLGGEIDPPSGGGGKKYLSKAEYDKEVLKRQQAQDDSFSQLLLSNPDAINDPALQRILRQDFNTQNPLDLNDIAVNPQIQPLNVPQTNAVGNYPLLGNDGGPGQVGITQPLTQQPTTGAGQVLQSNVAGDVTLQTDVEDVRPFANVSFEGKNWIPNSAAISKYKKLVDQGKDAEAADLVLGHFQKGKGGGKYRKSTHGEAEKLGNVIPINAGNLGDAFNQVPNAGKIFGELGKAGEFRTGGRIRYQNGGGFPPLGGIDPLNQPLNYTNRSQISSLPGDRPQTGGVGQSGGTPQYTTDPTKVDFTFDPNKKVKNSIKFGDYQGKGKLWTNDPNNIYTKDYVRGALGDAGLSEQQLTNFLDTPGYSEQYFDQLASDPNSKFAGSQFKNDRRFGPEHMQAILSNLDREKGGIDPIDPKGLPRFEANVDLDLLQQSGYNPPQGGPGGEPGGGPGGDGNLRGFGPDYLGSAVSALPNIGAGIGNLNLANNFNLDRTSAERFDPDYVDPTRAIQEVRNQYAGAKDVIRQNAGGSGALLSNLVGATASQAERTGSIASQYDNINAGISNQAEQFNARARQQANNANAQIQAQEESTRTNLRQQGYQNLAQGLNTGINTFFQSKRDADQLNIAGGENFYYRRVAGSQRPVKVFQGNGFHYYDDPKTGRRMTIDPTTGAESNITAQQEQEINTNSNQRFTDIAYAKSKAEAEVNAKNRQQ